MNPTVHPSRRQLFLGTAVAALATPALMTTAAAAPPWKAGFDTGPVDAALAAMLRDGAVGVTASVVGPRGSYLTAVGRRDLQKDGAKPQDRARIASITKAMIATLVMQRIEAGQWTLRTTIDQVTPGLYPGRGAVTVSQLMNHTSGMPDGLYRLLPETPWYTWTVQDLERAVVPYHSEEELVQLSRSLPWEFEPGTGWSYSNAGYVVLSLMLEAATGSRIQDLIRDRVFKPAGMHHSRLEESTLVRGRYLLPYGRFSAGLAPLPRVNPSIFSGAGGVYATAEDVTNFTGALMRGELLRKDLVDAMVTPVGAAAARRYGYGLYLITGPCRTAAGAPETLIGHDGAGFGTLSVSFTTRDASRRVALAFTGRPYVETGPDPDMNAVLVAGFRATCPAGSAPVPAPGLGSAAGGAGFFRL
ncbi:serine hydrolase domain-containing protein [Kocuria tytonis]|uniref:Class A beta-lactamase-related serine hydrolase n=1 Tax=Kocuria tytonis TaxID=2054280 RepID=A0A495A6N6_9MICC|nr:serine hydrolase domain-containing protein [Kocuria tytonis]RKQ35384.1 class A beta-lactamase-related serine hydrolase [Kocuria tytonis]